MWCRDSDHGSVLGWAQVVQKASKSPECAHPTCPTELYFHAASTLHVFVPWSFLPPAASCNIYKSQRARRLVSESSSEHTSPQHSREHWFSRRAFPTLPFIISPGALLQGWLTMFTKLGWDSRRAPWAAQQTLAQHKGLIQGLYNYCFIQISFSSLCGFSFQPICSCINKILLI